jgi:large subunit ribosomal protein L20
MARIKAGQQTRARRKNILAAAKGFQGRRKNTIRTATAAVWRAGQYAYRDRKAKKRNFRALWIQRINAAARQHDMTYSVFINGLLKAGVQVDRKVLSDIAIREPAAFAAVVEKAKAALAAYRLP